MSEAEEALLELRHALWVVQVITGDQTAARQVLTKYDAADSVKTLEQFDEVGRVFGFRVECVEELWEAVENGEVGERLKKGGGLQFGQAFILCAKALTNGPCSVCGDSPIADYGLEDEIDIIADLMDGGGA